jgi:UDP-2,3-diacylglucosamine hydrolase
MKAYFISDVHIKVEAKEKGQKLISFLKSLPADATHLILLGDIFDMWIGPHQYYADKFPNIIDELKKLKSRGVEIHYFEGNHDLHLKRYWQKQLGFRVHVKEFYFNFDGLVVRAEHGDQMNPEDKGYKFLRGFLRCLPMKIAIHIAPGQLINAIGDRSSKVSRVYSDRVDQEYKDKVVAMTHTHAQKVFSEKPYDLLVSGHTHVDDDFSFEKNGKKARAINLGSWLEKPKSLIITKDSQQILPL